MGQFCLEDLLLEFPALQLSGLGMEMTATETQQKLIVIFQFPKSLDIFAEHFVCEEKCI